MIVYNVQRRWFSEKADAEAYRKLRGLKPAATLKIEIKHRLDLELLLNALCEPMVLAKPAPGTVSDQYGQVAAIVDRAYIEPQRSVPDFVPLFLIPDPDQRKLVKADREARGLLA